MSFSIILVWEYPIRNQSILTVEKIGSICRIFISKIPLFRSYFIATCMKYRKTSKEDNIFVILLKLMYFAGHTLYSLINTTHAPCDTLSLIIFYCKWYCDTLWGVLLEYPQGVSLMYSSLTPNLVSPKHPCFAVQQPDLRPMQGKL